MPLHGRSHGGGQSCASEVLKLHFMLSSTSISTAVPLSTGSVVKVFPEMARPLTLYGGVPPAMLKAAVYLPPSQVYSTVPMAIVAGIAMVCGVDSSPSASRIFNVCEPAAN